MEKWVSWLGRHRLSSRTKYLWYCIHGLCIPFVLFLPIENRLLSRIIFPAIVITGARMTEYAREKPHLVPVVAVFESYGYTYTILGCELFYGWSSRLAHGIGVVLALRSLRELFRRRSYELFLLLLPVPLLHFHVTRASWYYLGLLGTFFSISHDSYWIFRRKPPTYARILIQSIPLVLFISSFTK